MLGPLAGIERDRLEVVDGAASPLIICEPDANDTRGLQCGSLLFSVVRSGAFVHVAMGSLHDDPEIRPQCDIFVGSKAPWFEITDGLAQFEEYAR